MKARALLAAVVALACAEHALSVATTDQLPRDMNLTWRGLPRTYDLLQGGDVVPVLRHLGQIGGWQDALVASWMLLWHPSGPAFASVSILWVGLTLVAVAGMARAWGGPWAGVAAAAMIAQAPAIVMIGRTGWVHTPEAALLACGGWALAVDPTLGRWRTVAAMAATGALALLLRPSGIVWVALLGLAAWKGWRRLPWVVAAWALATIPLVPELGQYVGGKMAVRGRYAEVVAGLGPQLLLHLGPGGCVLVIVAVGLGIRYRPKLPAEAVALTLGWAAAGLGLYAFFSAGLDNFPLVYVAAAVVAGVALATRTWGVGLALAGWLGFVGLTAYHDVSPKPPSQVATIRALLDATCPDRTPTRPCFVVADEGLFMAHPEEPGRLELFLMGERSTHLVAPTELRPVVPVPSAFVAWSCAPDRQGARAPRGQQRTAMLLQRWGLSEAWAGEVDGCWLHWLTRDGLLSGPAPVARSPS